MDASRFTSDRTGVGESYDLSQTNKRATGRSDRTQVNFYSDLGTGSRRDSSIGLISLCGCQCRGETRVNFESGYREGPWRHVAGYG